MVHIYGTKHKLNPCLNELLQPEKDLKVVQKVLLHSWSLFSLLQFSTLLHSLGPSSLTCFLDQSTFSPLSVPPICFPNYHHVYKNKNCVQTNLWGVSIHLNTSRVITYQPFEGEALACLFYFVTNIQQMRANYLLSDKVAVEMIQGFVNWIKILELLYGVPLKASTLESYRFRLAFGKDNRNCR